MREERRSTERVRTQLGALVIPSEGAPRRGRVDNVSRFGLWIDTPDAPEVGSLCTVAVELADARWPIRALGGTVVRRERNGFAISYFLDQQSTADELLARVRGQPSLDGVPIPIRAA